MIYAPSVTRDTTSIKHVNSGKLIFMPVPSTHGSRAMTDTFPDSIEMRVRPVFPTLIAEFDHPNPDSLNQRLGSFVQGTRDSGPKENRATTISQGWRSKSDLLDYDVPEIHELRSFFDQCVQSYVRYWAGHDGIAGAPSQFTHRYKGWAVVLDQCGFQHQHVHSRTDLVGVYCVHRPASTPEFPDVGGALTLVDPCTGRLSTQTAWESSIVALQPTPGRLFLLPSYVAHRVETLIAPGERMTINFDTIVLSR
jgi:hypothetical protein